MKFFVIISLCILNLEAFGSCLIRIHEGQEYIVTIWKHTDAKADQVSNKSVSAKELSEITGLLKGHKALTVIFNDGVFTSMRYEGQGTKRWAALSNAEKDMITFLQGRFDLTELKHETQNR